MNQDDSLDLESFPAWARDVLAAPARSRPAPRSALDYRGQPAWPLLLDAAVVAAFLPRQLAPQAVGGEARADAEKAVLGLAELTAGPDGACWSLTREARGEVLGAALGTGELAAALARTAPCFADPVSGALREQLQPGPSPLGPSPASPSASSPSAPSPVDLARLEAARAAAAMLTGVHGLSTLALDELDREIELGRTLAQFERMVGFGQAGSGPTPATSDCFFGRDLELERLRRYVGVVGPESLSQLAGRVAYGLVRTVTAARPLAVWGIGGVGKTTLIAKFMLEHARVASSRFPFAYLDFDRATISARDCPGLLAEMCQQVATQFAELAPAMIQLREQLRELGRKVESGPLGDGTTVLAPYAAEFRRQIDSHLGKLESFLESARPFVLVFDTFEVAQYAAGDVDGLEGLVNSFSQTGESSLWPRLRLIISGRKKVADFLGAVEELELGGLGDKGSCEMLVALAAAAGKSLAKRDADRLVAAIAKNLGEPAAKGVRPLRLRLVGQVFQQMQDADGATVARSLVDDLSQTGPSTGLARRLFVDGILVRRVLGHVVDARVRALADPGLVVRRITPAVIREVMARGTPRPGTEREHDDDPDQIQPWIVDDAEAASIFAAFAREVSLVEPDPDSAAGTALRHRQDVRQEMLPLIRDRRPRRFLELHRLGHEFFRLRIKDDAADAKAAAEAIYHGLWHGTPLDEIDTYWGGRGASFAPRLDPEEFADHPAASAYIHCKARERLRAEQVAELPRPVAVEWLAARSAALATVARLDDELPALLAAAGESCRDLDDHLDAAAPLARLLFRAGCWQSSSDLIERHLRGAASGDFATPSSPSPTSGHRRAALLSLLRTRATIAAKRGASQRELEWILAAATGVREPLLSVELLAYCRLGLAQLASRGTGASETTVDSTVARLRGAIDEAWRRVRPDEWRREPRILRLAILAGGEDVGDLLRIYLRESERLPHDPEAAGDVALLLAAVLQRDRLPAAEVMPLYATADSRSLSAQVLEKIDADWRRERPRFLEAVGSDARVAAALRRLVTFEHSDWTWVLGNALTRALARGDLEAGRIRGLLDRVEQQAATRGKRRTRGGDGVSIVQAVRDQGQLLRLARELSGSVAPASRAAETAVPAQGAGTAAAGVGAGTLPVGQWDGLAALAGAFVRWQQTLLGLLERSGNADPAST